MSSLAIVGAGPIGLEAAHRARTLGVDVRVYERAAHAGAHVRAWGHVRTFTPWSMLVGPAMRAAIGRVPSDDTCPTGTEFVRDVLDPAARALGDVVHYNADVVAISRDSVWKDDFIGDPTRANSTFRLLLRDTRTGREWIEHARAAIDASGVYGTPRWAGDGGIPAPGERALGDRITYVIPDVLGAGRATYSGARVLLVGSGSSAATTACALTDLGDAHLTWITREPLDALYPEDPADPLPERSALRARARAVLRDARTHHIGDARIDRFEETHAVVITARGEQRAAFDRAIVHGGFSPDNSLYRELQVHECYASRGPMNLAAALLGAGSSDCMTTPAFGADILVNPEPRFFILGNKSYGTRPDFLLRTGYEQVADVVPRLAEAVAAPQV